MLLTSIYQEEGNKWYFIQLLIIDFLLKEQHNKREVSLAYLNT